MPAEGFARVLSLADLPDDRILRVVAAGIPVCVYRLDGNVRAVQEQCSHASASLADGYIEHGLLFCPRHHGAFDARTGQPARLPCREPLEVFEVRLVGGDIYVRTG